MYQVLGTRVPLYQDLCICFDQTVMFLAMLCCQKYFTQIISLVDNTRRHFPAFFVISSHRLRSVPNLTLLIRNVQSQLFYHVTVFFAKSRLIFLKDAFSERKQRTFLLIYLI